MASKQQHRLLEAKMAGDGRVRQNGAVGLLGRCAYCVKSATCRVSGQLVCAKHVGKAIAGAAVAKRRKKGAAVAAPREVVT